MSKRSQSPAALTIAGSDSGGGAGIQADLKTFASLGVHGTCAITCVTAQTPRWVRAVQPCRAEIVRQQIEVVFEDLKPGAVKTGMLHSREIVRVVSGFFKGSRRIPLVIDPVMIATSGSKLIKTSAVKTLIDELLPLARIVTPNLSEAGVLAGHPVRSLDDMRTTAVEISRWFGCAALVKGGHLPHRGKAIDVFRDGGVELLLESPFVPGIRTHGTGCTLSAAIAGFLALGHPLPDAVRRAKDYISHAIANGRLAAKHFVLGHGMAVEMDVHSFRSRRARLLWRMR